MERNEAGLTIKARHDYRDAVSGEVVHVYGWVDLPVGIEGSEEFPLRIERWARVTGNPNLPKGRLLCHPNRLVEV